jgi:hypothetical protein
VKFSFIAKNRAAWPADWMCGALGVSRGGFYTWLTRPRSERSRSDEELGAKVRASFLASDRTYGARRVWHDPRLRNEPLRSNLPTNYTTLYEIHRLTTAQLAAALADGVIRMDMRRADLAAWMEGAKDAEDKPDVIGSILGHQNLSEGRLAMLQDSLRKALIGFPEIEIRGKGDKWSFRGVYPCIPSRPAVMCTAATGRTQDCTRPPRQTIKSTLAMREPSTQDIRGEQLTGRDRGP